VRPFNSYTIASLPGDGIINSPGGPPPPPLVAAAAVALLPRLEGDAKGAEDAGEP